MNTTTLQEDLADDFFWTTIQTERDENGTILLRQTVFDDNTTKVEEFADGNLSYVIQTDPGSAGNPSGAKPWESIETYYDANGLIEARIEQRDTGVTTTSEYDEGTLRRQIKEDLDEAGGPSDAQNWERIETYYDIDGQLEARVEVKDNGVTIEKEYEDGVLRFVTQQDGTQTSGPSDVKPWDSILTVYDNNGQLEARETFFDDGDITALLFEMGSRALKLELDGDESETWLVREPWLPPPLGRLSLSLVSIWT